MLIRGINIASTMIPRITRGDVMKSKIQSTVKSGLLYLLSPMVQKRATKLSAILGMTT